MRELTERQRKIMAIASVAIFLLFSLVIFWFIGKPLIKFVSEPEHFREWVDGKGILGRLAFIGMVVLQVFIAIIPGEPLEIGAGYAFGALEGTLLCLLGTTLGSVLVFSFVRRFGVRAVEVFFPREKNQFPTFLAEQQKAQFSGVYHLSYPWHAQGYPFLLRRADDNENGYLAIDFLYC